MITVLSDVTPSQSSNAGVLAAWRRSEQLTVSLGQNLYELEIRQAYTAWNEWDVCADSTQGLVVTADGYTSNNLDGDLLVWRKPMVDVAE